MCRQPAVPPRRIAVAAWLLVPEGRRRNLAGGKPASAGAAPGCRKRDMPQRGIGEVFGAVRRRRQIGPTAMVRHPGPFLRCPAGARRRSSPLPGAASAADLPPANLLRSPSGTGTGRPRPDHGKASAREWRSQVVRLRLRRAVFIVSRWSARRFPRHNHGPTAAWFRSVSGLAFASQAGFQNSPQPCQPGLAWSSLPMTKLVRLCSPRDSSGNQLCRQVPTATAPVNQDASPMIPAGSKKLAGGEAQRNHRTPPQPKQDCVPAGRETA